MELIDAITHFQHSLIQGIVLALGITLTVTIFSIFVREYFHKKAQQQASVWRKP